jgi:acetyl esterase
MKTPNRSMQEILNVYDSFNTPPLESLTPENARNLPTVADAVMGVIGKHLFKRALPFPEPVAEIEHITIPTSEGDLLARVYRPDPNDESLPVLLYFHGGGWVIANLDTYDSSCRAIANESGYLVVSVAYRQAPEHPFPAAVDDAFAAYQWLVDNAETLGGDASRIAVGGESAGGNLAAVVCLKAKEKGIKMPLHQLLIYPVTDFTFQGESHHENADAQPLSEAMMFWFKKHYLRDNDATHPDASPLHARDHTGLPIATIIVAEIDPLCSDGEAYAEKLRSAGIPVQLRKFEGVTHEFFGAKAVLDEAKEAISFACNELQDALLEYRNPEEFQSSPVDPNLPPMI